MPKDDEVAAVAAKLDALLADLDGTVATLNAILTRPQQPPAPPEADERLVKP